MDIKKMIKLKDLINEDRFGHPITAQGNQTYIQLEKLIKMLSGKEKRDAEKAKHSLRKVNIATCQIWYWNL